MKAVEGCISNFRSFLRAVETQPTATVRVSRTGENLKGTQVEGFCIRLAKSIQKTQGFETGAIRK